MERIVKFQETIEKPNQTVLDKGVVKVHLTMLSDLPDPLSEREFRLICRHFNINVPDKLPSPPKNTLRSFSNDKKAIKEHFEKFQRYNEDLEVFEQAREVYKVY